MDDGWPSIQQTAIATLELAIDRWIATAGAGAAQGTIVPPAAGSGSHVHVALSNQPSLLIVSLTMLHAHFSSCCFIQN